MNPMDVDANSTTVVPQIADHEIIRRIGKGSYGVVWLAKSIIGGFHAVKVIERGKFTEDRPYQREFDGICKFNPISRSHPGLVSILHVGKNEEVGYFYYVMELADDVHTGQTITPDTYLPRTLKEEMANHPRLPIKAKIQIALSLTSALGHIHEQGLIHRDIKPSNIIFVNGVPKIADIGLITEAGEDVSKGGTLYYMPPEGPGKLADIFSLGKVFYELFMGMHPKDYPELPHAAEEFTSVPELLCINNLILKACHHDPRQRFQTTKELSKALQAVAETVQERQPGSGTTEKADSRSSKPAIETRSKTATANAGKTTGASEARPATSGEQRTKALWTRRATLIGIGGAITGGVFLAMRDGWKSVGLPVVVLMDSAATRAVYDQDLKDAGKTNAEELKKLLGNLPLGVTPQITISDESSKPDWRGENEVIRLEPKLVLIHRSAFFHGVNNTLGLGYPPFTGPDAKEKSDKWEFIYGMSDEKLNCFMGHVATVLPGTKFLIYSRGTDVRWTDAEFRDKWKTNCEERFPALKGCVNTVLIMPSTIPGSERGTFKDPKTAEEIRGLVRKILGLPEKAKLKQPS